MTLIHCGSLAIFWCSSEIFIDVWILKLWEKLRDHSGSRFRVDPNPWHCGPYLAGLSCFWPLRFSSVMWCEKRLCQFFSFFGLTDTESRGYSRESTDREFLWNGRYGNIRLDVFFWSVQLLATLQSHFWMERFDETMALASGTSVHAGLTELQTAIAAPPGSNPRFWIPALFQAIIGRQFLSAKALRLFTFEIGSQLQWIEAEWFKKSRFGQDSDSRIDGSDRLSKAAHSPSESKGKFLKPADCRALFCPALSLLSANAPFPGRHLHDAIHVYLVTFSMFGGWASSFCELVQIMRLNYPDLSAWKIRTMHPARRKHKVRIGRHRGRPHYMGCVGPVWRELRSGWTIWVIGGKTMNNPMKASRLTMR